MRGFNGRSVLEEIEKLSESGEIDVSQKERISRSFGIPLSNVESLVSFYSEGHEKNAICSGLPCRLKRRGIHKTGETEEEYGEASCLGYCDKAPVLMADGKFYAESDMGREEIVESNESFVDQNRENVDSYVVRGGYSTLEDLIEDDDYSSTILRLEESGLKGMGGAGFPVHLKWKSFGKNRLDDSYLLVNAHEGEPGTFKDRGIMELTPHSLLEGAIFTALSNRIPRIVIGIKREYLLAYRSLMLGLDELKVKFGEGSASSMLPEIQVIRTGGTYITGEETALMEAIEGRRSEPRLRPPFPTEKGLYGAPTLVHNVETLSLIPELMRRKRPGFIKLYCLTGDVKESGVFALQTGISAQELLKQHGKTQPDTIKAFMPGGLSGGILPASSLSINLDSASVKNAGAGLGTGAFIAISKDRCLVDIASLVNRFFETESCGKCAPCRLGTRELSSILQRISSGVGSDSDIEHGRDVAGSMMEGSICALGQAAGKMFLDSVDRFHEEFELHLGGECPAGVCPMEEDGH